MTDSETATAASAPTRATTMRAAVVDRFGGPEHVRVDRVPKPEPAADEVLVRVRAATVSVADHRLRARDIPRGLSLLVAPTIGLFRPRVHVLGMDVAGVVESVGSAVTRFAPGDEVIAMLGSRMGGHAEYVAVPQGGDIPRKPATLSFEEAAAIVFGGHTAMRYLARVELRPGAEVLVNGASGAVGIAAVQLAARRGARVTAVTSARNAALVRANGASRVVDHEREDFAAGASGAYDVIVECAGTAPFPRVRHLIRPGGALLQVIADLGDMLAAPWRSRRSGILVTSTGDRVGPDGMQRLAELAEAGDIRPVIDRVVELDGIVDAHRYVDTGRKRGSVVVRLG
ncbi:NAD(P)-dependent alcohol dehydrogenase [Agromyces aurantiacus]|uniref:NAD(P)-dependent alcohol dehydrogenase n=1 Tax=Agromyces aurantiacus TaxID=165814 RepID=A0ABV9R654_9MICO|nr:NAD(P)-dependent alcohol dehydrogenase [Agromyces aurantiacus]MBM7503637.1 NADPH:quinone reductase-like Zn-dependent oxidoreductase [Agromyces aurantiacus]